MPDERIPLLLVGLNFGQWMIENELGKGDGARLFRLAAVCDLDAEKAARVGERYGVPAYCELAEALTDPGIRAVLLMTGPVGRAEFIRQALRRGLPVMTTKPLETSASEARAVLLEAARLGVPLHMNSPAPVAGGELRAIERWREEFALGRLVGYRGATWCSYREQPDGSWYDNPQACPAAPLFRLGIYLLNDLCRFVAPVRDVQVLQSRLFTGRPTADNALLSLVHEDGTLGSLYATFCCEDGQPYRCELELCFEHGTVWRNAGLKWTDEISLALSAQREGQRVTREERVTVEGVGYQWATFADAIHGKPVVPTVTPEQVASAIRVLELMRERQGVLWQA